MKGSGLFSSSLLPISAHHPNPCRCAPQDVKLPEDDQAVKDMSVDERDGIVGGVYRKLMEIEVRTVQEVQSKH